MGDGVTTDPVQFVLDHLEGYKAVGDRQWIARCPGHDDHTPSLSIGVGADGRVLLHCQAGCTFDEVLAAMNPAISKSDLFPKHASPNSSAKSNTLTNESDRPLK